MADSLSSTKRKDLSWQFTEKPIQRAFKYTKSTICLKPFVIIGRLCFTHQIDSDQIVKTYCVSEMIRKLVLFFSFLNDANVILGAIWQNSSQLQLHMTFDPCTIF